MSRIRWSGSRDHNEEEAGGCEASKSRDERSKTEVPSGNIVRTSSSIGVKYLLYGDTGVPVGVLHWRMNRRKDYSVLRTKM